MIYQDDLTCPWTAISNNISSFSPSTAGDICNFPSPSSSSASSFHYMAITDTFPSWRRRWTRLSPTCFARHLQPLRCRNKTSPHCATAAQSRTSCPRFGCSSDSTSPSSSTTRHVFCYQKAEANASFRARTSKKMLHRPPCPINKPSTSSNSSETRLRPSRCKSQLTQCHLTLGNRAAHIVSSFPSRRTWFLHKPLDQLNSAHRIARLFSTTVLGFVEGNTAHLSTFSSNNKDWPHLITSLPIRWS